MIGRAGTAAAIALTVACSPQARSPAHDASPAVPAPVACTLRGELRGAAGTTLHATADGASPIARLTGHAVGVEVTALAAAGSRRAEVTLRAPERGPALRLSGFIDGDELPLRAARPIEIAGAALRIAEGAPLTVLGGAGPRVRVETPFFPRFFDAATDVPCDALTLAERGAPKLDPLPAGAQPHHLRADGLTLLEAPGARPLRRLRARSPALLTLHVVASSGAFRRVVVEDWLRLSAWVPAEEIAPGEGADCDDCRGSIRDVEDLCLDAEGRGGFVDFAGCPSLPPERRVHAISTTAVRDRPSPGARAIGAADAGAPLWKLAEVGDFVRVLPRPPTIQPPSAPEVGFWIARRDLEEDGPRAAQPAR